MKGEPSRCTSCGADVVLVLVIPETPRRGRGRRRIPLDPDYDPATSALAASHALTLAGTTCRPITRDHPLSPSEDPALTHFATCPSRQTPGGVPVRYTTRPLSDRAWLRPADDRRDSAFKVSWSTALDLLDRELVMLDGSELVIEIDVREQDLRLDGMLRANARATEPAVIVAFESKHGPLLYRSDQYAGAPSWRRGGMTEGWQHNVYAVALTLEALRAVDRYGAARSGEQYRGYRQIGAGPAIVPDAPMTRDAAALVLARAAYPDASGPAQDIAHEILTGRLGLDVVARRARRFTHPDAGGSPEAFRRVEDALRVLRGAR